MKNMEQDKQIQLKQSVLQRLENDDVHPTSKTWFLYHNLLSWSLWLLATFVGALAVAVSLFVLTYHQYAFYELTHDNLFTFLEDVLPILWFLILVVMIIFSVYSLRQTSRGYRYASWQLLVSSLALSFVMGIFLHFMGVGFSFDKWLGGVVSSYESQEEMELRLWQKPEEGRLLGVFVKNDTVFPFSAIFVDVNGMEWRIDTTDLLVDEVEELESGKNVRMIGKVISEDSHYFHSCGVFLNIYGPDYAEYELKEYKYMAKMRLEHFYSSSSLVEENSLCSELPSIQRLKADFH